MAADLTFTAEAAPDLDDAYAWYERRRRGLVEDFLSSVDACIQAIRRNPEMYPIVHESYRRGLMRRFPYAVFYDYNSGAVTVHGVFHTLQDPQKWRERLP